MATNDAGQDIRRRAAVSTARANRMTKDARQYGTRADVEAASDAHGDARDAHTAAAQAFIGKNDSVAALHREAAKLHKSARRSLYSGVPATAVPDVPQMVLAKREPNSTDHQGGFKMQHNNDLRKDSRFPTPFKAAQEGRLDRSQPRTSTDPSATASERTWTPGVAMAASDEELYQTVSRGPTALSNPPKQEEYERNAAHAEASKELMRRVGKPAGYDALSDPLRAKTQMQPIPRTPSVTMTPARANASTMSVPVTAMDDQELARQASALPNELPFGTVNAADYDAVNRGRAIRAELVRRSTTPANKLSMSELTGWK